MASEPDPLDPSLGPLLSVWAAWHCIVPDGFRKGEPFRHYGWQREVHYEHYRVRPEAQVGQLATAFVRRRSLVVGPQKALALDTPIATDSGWSTMADIAAGDVVFDADGLPTRVLSKSPVWLSDTYRVAFTDGSSLVACGDHEWVVDRRTASSTYVPERRSTREIAEMGVERHGARIWRVPVARPLDLPDSDLPIPPYTLGAWLGDGESSGGRITGIDEGVFTRIELEGFVVTRTKIHKRRQVHGLTGLLRRADVLNNKHVPSEYLRASEKQRWALLQGLMDTDGYAGKPGKGNCEYTTTSPALRDGFMELARSLGLRPTAREGVARLNGRATGPKWRIGFPARSDMPVFGLDRKQGRLPPPGRGHAQLGHRRIASVEPIPPVPTQCITVASPTHTFLAGREMIPTGNTGKGPWAASFTSGEAVGPVLFAGWASYGDRYDCHEHGCRCPRPLRISYDELANKVGMDKVPMGMPWPTPLIQLLATSEDQVANVYRPLQAMARGEMLAPMLTVGEEFIRIGTEGRIDVVTSSATSRLGQPLTCAVQDESGIYTKTNKMVAVAETQRRGLAGMGGRAVETTNAWDPTQDSTAQRTARAAERRPDIYLYHKEPPASLGDFAVKADRRKILAHAYDGSDHVDLDAIEAEAAELIIDDPRQAERFFGNRIVAGSAKWTTPEAWDELGPKGDAPIPKLVKGDRVAIGMDGSDGTAKAARVADSTVIRGCRLSDGYRFTIGVWEHEPDPSGEYSEWYVPRLEVMEKIRWAFAYFDVALAGFDPPYWRNEIAELAEEFGEDRIVEFRTANDQLMAAALQSLSKTDTPHDGDPIVRRHVLNAVTHIKEYRDDNDERKKLVLVSKPTKDSPDKIDALISDAIAHDMRNRAIAAGNRTKKKFKAVAFG